MQAPDTTLLAFETATSPGGVALLRDGEVVLERVLPRDVSTAESLLPAVDALLAEAKLDLAAIGAFAVSIGPGSFTGLRIGVATVKGLAFETRLPVAPVPTLAALALTAGAGEGPGPIVAALDARRGEVYAAGYAHSGDLLPDVLPEGLYDTEELVRRLPPVFRLVGEGAGICGEAVRRALGAGAVVEAAPVSPAAADVARLGARRLAAGGGLPAAQIAPRYVRRAEAEVRRTGRATEL